MIVRGEFRLSLNDGSITSDKCIYRTLLLSELSGQKLEWTPVFCLGGGKSFTVADVCEGWGVQDGHGEKVRESQRPLHRVGQPQTLLAGLLVPGDPTSRLIAIVQLADGFSLMLGAMGLSQR